MVRMEQCNTITHSRVRSQDAVSVIANGTSSSTPHHSSDSHKAVQIIIDNHLTGQRNHLALGGSLDGFLFFTERAIGVFTIFLDGFQRIKRTQTDTAIHLEVRNGTNRTPFTPCFRKFTVCRLQFLADGVFQQVREVRR